MESRAAENPTVLLCLKCRRVPDHMAAGKSKQEINVLRA